LREAVNFLEPGKTLRKIGPTTFGQMVKAMLNEHFHDLMPDRVRVVGDPAAWSARDRDDDEHDWVLTFKAALGLPAHKAKTNRQGLRNAAVWKQMSETGGYQVDPSCKHLIRGHLGGYRYAKPDLSTGETRGHLEIADTIHTHVCDAEQYAAVEGDHVISDLRGFARQRGPVVNDSEFDVFLGA
jgi:hypothetical protein